MTSIDPRSNLLAAAREQLASLRHSQKRAPAAASQTNASSRAGEVSSPLAQRLRALDPQDPDRPGTAVRLYFESELLREFGDDLLKDPAFSPMVDAVQAQMREDPQIAAAAEALGEWLVQQHQA
jgi:hypothetical protein